MDADGWRRRQDYRQGARIGLFLVFGLPALVALAGYLLGGGSIAELVPALMAESLNMLVAFAAGPFGILLIPLALWVYLRWWRPR